MYWNILSRLSTKVAALELWWNIPSQRLVLVRLRERSRRLLWL